MHPKDVPLTEPPPLPVETSVKDELSQAVCLKDVLLSNDYPLMKKLKLVVPKLSETDIDVWSDKVHTYYTYNPPNVETDLKPVIVNVCGYSLHSGNINSHKQHEDVSIKKENSLCGTEIEPPPKKTKDSCPPQSDPSPERLLAHANVLINKVSSFVTKLTNVKYGKQGIVLTGEKSKRHVESLDVSKDSSLPVETTTTLTTEHTTPDKPLRTI